MSEFFLVIAFLAFTLTKTAVAARVLVIFTVHVRSFPLHAPCHLTHDLETVAERCDRALLLEHSRPAALGSAADVVAASVSRARR